jgi:hypothetical protein
VAGGLVDPPGREVGHPRVQKNECWPDVNLATAEVLDGARDEREPRVSPAGESVGSTEGRGGERYKAELPCPADVEAPLEDSGRAREVPATEVGEAEIDQPLAQREGMIGRFSDPHSGLGVPDGLVEPPELGEHVGKAGRRECRLAEGRPEALIAQVALERNIPLGEGGRVAELAAGSMRPAQIGRCDDLDRAIAEGARETQGLPPRI